MFHEWTRINIIMKRARIFAAVSSGGLPPLIFHLKINIFVRFSSVLFSGWIAPEAKRVRKTGINTDNLSEMTQLWVGTIRGSNFELQNPRNWIWVVNYESSTVFLSWENCNGKDPNQAWNSSFNEDATLQVQNKGVVYLIMLSRFGLPVRKWIFYCNKTWWDTCSLSKSLNQRLDGS